MTRAKRRLVNRPGKYADKAIQEFSLAPNSNSSAPFTSSQSEEKCMEMSAHEEDIAITHVRQNTKKQSNSAKRKKKKSEQLPPRAAKLEMNSVKVEGPEESEEVVRDSQEMPPPPNSETKGIDDLDSKMESFFSFYKQYSGERCRLPDKTKCPLRDEYRKLFCAASMCEKLGILLTSRLDSGKRLRNMRLESLSEVKALCLRLEDLVASEMISEKYLSFDDVAQRDALEIMGIRYEELSDDIFASDDALMSLFDAGNDKIRDAEGELDVSKSSSGFGDAGANYAEICMQSMLTEVGLCYVNKVDKLVKRMTSEAAEYHTRIAAQVSRMNDVALEHSKNREDLGDLATIVDKVLGVETLEPNRESLSS